MKAAIYVRYSSDNQRDESIEAQIRAIKEYCVKNAIEVVKIYTDEALTATSDKRPAFLQMIDDSKRIFFDSVIVHKLDRFARNRYDSAFYKKKLKDNGIKVISILEYLDDSPESIILESVLEGMAEYFSRNLSREVSKGLKENALKAKHNGGPPPLGFDVTHDKSYSINEKESKIILKIFELYLSGSGYTNISQTLNAMGYLTKAGKAFSKVSIRDILMNEKYIGTYVYNRRADGKSLHKLNPEEEIIRVQNALPKIIKHEDFKKVKEIMEKGKRGPVVKKEYYLLTGKLVCGECESSYTGIGYMTGKNKDNKYYQYGCVGRKKNGSCNNKNIRKDYIENYIVQRLKDEIFNNESIEKISNELAKLVTEYNSSHGNEIKETQKKVKDIEIKISKTFDMYFDDNIDKTLLASKTNELKLELQLQKEKLIFLETKDFSWTDESKIKLYLQHSKENLESEDKLRKRKVIEIFVDTIKIYSDRIETDFIIKGVQGVSDKSSGAKPHLTISLTQTKSEAFSQYQ